MAVKLYLTFPDGTAFSRNRFNLGVRKPTIRAAGKAADRRNGMHVPRHTYASVLLDAGERQLALGLPGPHRSRLHRRAIDKAFGEVQADDRPAAGDGLETA